VGQFRCVIHGSFRRHFELIQETVQTFQQTGIEVLAPALKQVIGADEGFVLLEGEEGRDPRLIELEYLQHLKRIGPSGFSFFVNPEGYIGRSASYELGIAQAINVPCFFREAPRDHPAYLHANSVWSPVRLARYIKRHGALPGVRVRRDERELYRLWEKLLVPGSVVAAGGIIESEVRGRKEILLVQTHKWGGRFSMVGGRVRRGERLADALRREVREETRLKIEIGQHLCAFDQIRDSGYYRPVQHIFVDFVVRASSRRIRLNDEAEAYVWIPAKRALEELPLEPNARHTIEVYAGVGGNG
jgi:ADP-ribose pyrophosphatase YjhB (NUDIX family)